MQAKIMLTTLLGTKRRVGHGDRVIFKGDTFRVSRIDGFRVYLMDEYTGNELSRAVSASELMTY